MAALYSADMREQRLGDGEEALDESQKHTSKNGKTILISSKHVFLPWKEELR